MLTWKNLLLKRLARLVCALAATACADKAQPDFERCLQLEQAKNYDEARKACELAVSKDPESKQGKMAAARLPVLATEQHDDIDPRDARASRAAADLQTEKSRLQGLKARYDQTVAREASLKSQLAHTTDPSEKASVSSELAKAVADEAAAMKDMTSGNSKPGCACAPNDPLCSCL